MIPLDFQLCSGVPASSPRHTCHHTCHNQACIYVHLALSPWPLPGSRGQPCPSRGPVHGSLNSPSVAPFTQPRPFQSGCPVGSPARSPGSVLTTQALSDWGAGWGEEHRRNRADAGSHQVPRGAEEAAVCPTQCLPSGYTESRPSGQAAVIVQ